MQSAIDRARAKGKLGGLEADDFPTLDELLGQICKIGKQLKRQGQKRRKRLRNLGLLTGFKKKVPETIRI